MLRNLNATSGGRRILGVPTVGILSSIIVSQTASGDSGPGLLYDEASNPTNAGKHLRVRITGLPSSGTLFVYENGAIDFAGAANNTYTIGYDVDADDVFLSSDTATIIVGAVPGVTLTGTSTLTAGSSSGTSPGVAPGVILTGTSDLTAGGASGGSGVVNAPASGATLTGTSSIVAGSATGVTGTMTLTPDDIQAIVDALVVRVLPVNIVRVNHLDVDGTGTANDPWGPV